MRHMDYCITIEECYGEDPPYRKGFWDCLNSEYVSAEFGHWSINPETLDIEVTRYDPANDRHVPIDADIAERVVAEIRNAGPVPRNTPKS